MQRRLAAAVAILVVGAVGCSGPAEPEPVCFVGTVRACTCDDGSSSTQRCAGDRTRYEPCRCDGMDAGSPVDAGVDAGTELDAATPRDAGRDAGRDAYVPPPPPSDAGSDAGVSWGECSVTPAADCDPVGSTGCGRGGCPVGQTCRMTRPPERGGQPYGPPSCEPIGPQQWWSTECCWDGADQCGQGQVCVGNPGVFGCGCRVYCNLGGEPCPTGYRCWGPVPYAGDGGVPAGFDVHICVEGT